MNLVVALEAQPFTTRHLLNKSLQLTFQKKMIEIAKNKALKADALNINFQRSSLANYPVDEHKFDMVMAHSIFHLVPNMEKAIHQSYHLLKPGGVLITSSTCLGHSISSQAMRLATGLFSVFDLLPQLNLFSEKELISKIENAGFKVEYQWQPEKSQVIFIVARKPFNPD